MQTCKLLHPKRIVILVITAVVPVLFSYGILYAAVSQTPPMGWNSYDCFNYWVTEAEVKANADYMAENLKQYGWEYICVDWAWYYTGTTTGSPNQDASFNPKIILDSVGRMLPNPTRFPSSANGQGLKPLIDYVHSKGLKFGFHLMRGIPRQAVSANLPILGTSNKAGDVADKVNLCAWLNLMYGLNMNHQAAQKYLNSLFELYASWGLDFVKVDDLINPYGAPAFRESEVKGYRTAIDNCGRDIVFSTSPGATPLANAAQIKQYANQWRMANDLWDNWDNLNAMFDLANNWYTHAGPGHWPDADMIPIGKVSKHGPNGNERYSNLTSNEKYTMMSLWIIARSPLIWGGNMVENRAEELKLMQNDEALAVNQKSTNSRPIVNGTTPVWCADIPGSNAKYIAFFNRNSTAKDVSVNFSDIGLTGTVYIRDLWAKADKGSFTGSYKTSVPSHGSVLFKMTGEPPAPRSAFEKIEAESFTTQSGIQTETCSEGGEDIGFIENGDYAVYSNIDFSEGALGVQIRTASAGNGGTIEIVLDSINGTSVGTCKIDPTGDWKTWTTGGYTMSKVSGKHDVFLKFTGESGYLFNVNWIQFVKTAVLVNHQVSLSKRPQFKTVISNGYLEVIPENYGAYMVTICTPDGRVLFNKKSPGKKVTVSLMSKGVYFVTVAGNGRTERKMISNMSIGCR